MGKTPALGISNEQDDELFHDRQLATLMAIHRGTLYRFKPWRLMT
jgi:hypothetical protein